MFVPCKASVNVARLTCKTVALQILHEILLRMENIVNKKIYVGTISCSNYMLSESIKMFGCMYERARQFFYDLCHN